MVPYRVALHQAIQDGASWAEMAASVLAAGDGDGDDMGAGGQEARLEQLLHRTKR